MKSLLFLFLGFLAQGLIAQCDDSIIFTESDKESFVQVYLSVKNEKPNSSDQVMFDLVEKYKITPTQFQEIQDPQNISRALSANEAEFVTEVQKMKVQYKEKLDKIERKLCESNSLSKHSYDLMKLQFRSCMRFQRSLSDYFTKWMEK